MSSYAFWNNKGGVGKSFLCFVAASEYAYRYPNTDYTQLALVAAENVVVPFTADDSSRRAIENIVTLLYGLTDDAHTKPYAKISFGARAKQENLSLPKLHTFISNRVTLYEGTASKAFEAANKIIKQTTDKIYRKHRHIFANPKELPSDNFLEIPPSDNFLEIPDYHSACVVATIKGVPLHNLKPGPNLVHISFRLAIHNLFPFCQGNRLGDSFF